MVPLLTTAALGLPGWSNHLAAGHEACGLVGHADGGDHQPVGVDLGAFVERHARLVDQHDLAVGVDVAGDLRRIGSGHAVQRDGGARWLVEGDALLAADVEALPVDGGALGGLVDRGVAGTLTDRGRAADHHAAGGTRVRRRLRLRGQRKDEREAGLQGSTNEQISSYGFFHGLSTLPQRIAYPCDRRHRGLSH